MGFNSAFKGLMPFPRMSDLRHNSDLAMLTIKSRRFSIDYLPYNIYTEQFSHYKLLVSYTSSPDTLYIAFSLTEVFFRAFSSVIRQIPGYNSQRRGTARTLPNQFDHSGFESQKSFLPKLLIVLFYALFVCKCVLYYCHRVST